MKEHKVRQEYYHRTTKIEMLDDFNVVTHNIEPGKESLICSIVDYLTVPYTNDTLPCPTKSYAVALIFATLISNHFNEDFIEMLSDPTLLYGNDSNFSPYSLETSDIYDEVIKRVPNIVDNTIPQTASTIKYFIAEFCIDKEP